MEVDTTEMERAVQNMECGKSLNDITFNYTWNPYALTNALCGPHQPLVRPQPGLYTDVLPIYPQTENDYIRRIQQKDNTGALKLWLLQHKKNPYPSKPEKIMLAILAKMTLTQVSTWFANARRRLKKDYPDADYFNSGTGHVIYYQKK